MQTYYAKYNKDPKSTDWHDWPYFARDGAVQGPGRYFRILGRVDDVVNVAGHRLGTKELESATLMVEEVAEAAEARASSPVPRSPGPSPSAPGNHSPASPSTA